ncbi:MAG: VacJ family lipoprotein [Pacificimonas sp.]
MRRTRLVFFAPLMALTACATTPSAYDAAEGDPWEGFNRSIYSFNDAVDGAVLKPAAQGYRAVVPQPVRTGVSNALDNVDEPVSFINAILQGKFKRAFRAVDRFAVNTTYGVLGTTDRAAELGLDKQSEDFGQTLAVWGVGSGPYLVLPIFGPSSIRDAVGFGVGQVTNPWGRFQSRTLDLTTIEQGGVAAFEAVELRNRLIDTADPLLENALDPYATIKSAYIQTRTAEIFDGNPPAPADDGFDSMEDFEPMDDFIEDDPVLTDPEAPQASDPTS